MSNRENTLAVALVALIFLGGGGVLGYMLVLNPLWKTEQTAAAIDKDIEKLDGTVKKLRNDTKRLAIANKRSLPTEQSVASTEYSAMIERLVRHAYGEVLPSGFSITEKKISEVKVAVVPGQQAKKAPYSRIALEVEFKKADMWVVHDFLTAYYQLNLLQQITALNIKRDDEGAAAKKGNVPDRKDLTVKLTTEALILDGADPRRTLLPVSHAFAAVGGFAGYQAIALTPEAGRGITPTQFVPVLATRPRDYTLIVRKDPFHGTYVDPKAPPPPVATKPKEKEDISNSIILGGVVTASDRTAYTTIRDSYNPFNYTITATPKGITVEKFSFKGKNKERVPNYPGNDMLVFSDNNVSLTNRTFRVIEVDVDGLVLLDLTPPSATPAPKAEGKGSRSEAPMPRPGMPMGGKGPRPTPSNGPSLNAPLAGVVGGAAAITSPSMRLYRWSNGKPLKSLTEIPSAEAQKILERAAAEGPVRLVATAEETVGNGQ